MNERGLFGNIPEMTFSPEEMQLKLQEPIMWWREKGRTISFGEYVSAHFPNMANKLGIVQTEAREDIQIGKISDSKREDWKELTLVNLQSFPQDLGMNGLSIDELIEEVRKGTGLGNTLVESTRRSSELLLHLAKRGKLRVDPNKKPESELKIPDFPF